MREEGFWQRLPSDTPLGSSVSEDQGDLDQFLGRLLLVSGGAASECEEGTGVLAEKLEEEAELRDLAFGAIEGGQAFEQHSGRGSPAQRSPAPRTGSPQHFAATPTGMRFSASPVFSSPSDGIHSPGREQELDAEMSILKGGGTFPGGRSPQPPWPEEQQQEGVWLPAETVRMQKAQIAAMESRLCAQQQEE